MEGELDRYQNNNAAMALSLADWRNKHHALQEQLVREGASGHSAQRIIRSAQLTTQ